MLLFYDRLFFIWLYANSTALLPYIIYMLASVPKKGDYSPQYSGKIQK